MWFLKKKSAANDGLQKTFVIVLVSAYILQSLMTIFSGLEQSGLAPLSDMGPFTIFLAQQILVPAFFFAVAYVLNPHKLSMLGKLFESTLFTVIGLVVIGTALTLSLHWSSAVYMDYMVLESAVYVIGPLGYAALLVYIRQTKRWK